MVWRGLGGALSLGVLGLEPTFPLKYLVLFLMVVCVGGAGTIIGPFVAALVVGVVDVAGSILARSGRISDLCLYGGGFVGAAPWFDST